MFTRKMKVGEKIPLSALIRRDLLEPNKFTPSLAMLYTDLYVVDVVVEDYYGDDADSLW